MNQKETRHFTYAAAIYGLYIGGILIGFDILLWLFTLKGTSILQNFNIILLIVGIVLGTRHYRDVDHKGYITYNMALGLGTFISFFSSLILGFYTYVLMKYIDPDLIGRIVDLVEQQMLEQGISDDQIDAGLAMSRQLTTPLILAFSTIFSITFWGFICSLLISLFLKKQPNPFTETDNTNIA